MSKLVLAVIAGGLVFWAAGPADAAFWAVTGGGPGTPNTAGCLSGDASCAGTDKVFDLVATSGATGSFDFTPDPVALLADIDLFVSSMTLSRVSGAGSVNSVIFENVTYSGQMSVTDNGFQITGTAPLSGSVSGNYHTTDGLNGTGAVVDASTFFNEPGQPTVLLCTFIIAGSETCQVQFGVFDGFTLGLDGTPHDFQVKMDVGIAIPEPATPLMLLLGLAGLIAARRRAL